MLLLVRELSSNVKTLEKGYGKGAAVPEFVLQTQYQPTDTRNGLK
jgi:hypothetical protein